MPTTFGDTTKSIFLNGPESHKMALQFEAAAPLGKIEFSADLVTSNKVNLKIQGTAMAEVTFTSTHNATMALLVTAIKAITGVADAKISPLDPQVIYFYLTDETATPAVTNAAVTSGDSQATITSAVVTNNIFPGMPVGLIGSNEKVATMEWITAWLGSVEAYRFVGVSIHTATPGELLTAYVRGYTVVYGVADGAVTAGPVKVTGYDATQGYVKYAVTTLTTNPVGWALDNEADTEVVRILLGW